MALKEKLLEAFAIEHSELLSRIRGAMDDLTAGKVPEWDEAFRAAHSLKGAARVCDLAEISQIGADLQTIFGKARDGSVKLTAQQIAEIRMTSDAVQAGAKAAIQGTPAPDLSSAADSLKSILKNGEVPSIAESKTANLESRLLAAFKTEYEEHLEAIRSVLGCQNSETLSAHQIDDIFRRAHSIKGAARVNHLDAVENLAHGLESLFTAVREGRSTLNSENHRIVTRGLDSLEDAASAALQKQPIPDTGAALEAIRAISGDSEKKKPESADLTPVRQSFSDGGGFGPSSNRVQPATATESPEVESVETLRISSTALDRILDTAGQLVAECVQQETFTGQIDEAARKASSLFREWEVVRKQIQGSHRNSNFDEMDPLVRGINSQVNGLRHRQKGDHWALSRLARQLQEDVRRARFVPASTVFQGFRKMVRDLAGDEGKPIDVAVSGLEVEADRMVLQELKDPVMHLLRNAVSHGIEKPEIRRANSKAETARISLRILAEGSLLVIEVEDDGAGIDLERVRELALKRGFLSEVEAEKAGREELGRLIFNPHFSTSRVITEVSGRGMGLSVVSNTAARLQGAVEVKPGSEHGTLFRIAVPLTLAAQRVVEVSSQGQSFAIPFTGIERLLTVPGDEIRTIEGRPFLARNQNGENSTIPLTSLEILLGLPDAGIRMQDEKLAVVQLHSAGKRVAVSVDSFSGVRDAIVKDLPLPASRNPLVSGAILTERGSLSLVLNPTELIRGFTHAVAAPVATQSAAPVEKTPGRVLVVDDSFTTRTLEKSLLEAHGFVVLIAVDGIEGLSKLRSEEVDLAIIDVEMPRMDGFTMLEEMKKDPVLQSVPVIMVTSMESRTDIERGLNLGAEAYIVKRKFDHQELLNTIEQIL